MNTLLKKQIPGLIDVTFIEVLGKYNCLEIHPCKHVDEENVSTCGPDEAEFWTVYYHLVEGGLYCIADFDTESNAIDFKKFLESFLKFHAPEDEATITWTVDDVEWTARQEEIFQIEQAGNEALAEQLTSDSQLPIPNEHRIYDRTKFRETLHMMVDNHDANEGITWTTIESYLDDHCKR